MLTGTSFFILYIFSASFPSCILPPKENPSLSMGTPLSLPSRSQRGELGVKLEQEAQSEMLAEQGRGAVGEAGGGEVAENWGL